MLLTLKDLFHALAQWRRLFFIARIELLMHYRRSILGPLWFSINMFVFGGVLAFVYSKVFHIGIGQYFIYVMFGFVGWSFLAAVVNEGMYIFINQSELIRNSNRSLWSFPIQFVIKQVLVFMHHLAGLVLIIAFGPAHISVTSLLVFVAIGLYIMAAIPIATLVAMLCSRFRDSVSIITNFMQFLFFVTPIFWDSRGIEDRRILDYNVAYHFIEIFRAPLLGITPTITNYLIVLATIGVAWIVSLLIFNRYSSRIVHAI